VKLGKKSQWMLVLEEKRGLDRKWGVPWTPNKDVLFNLISTLKLSYLRNTWRSSWVMLIYNIL